VSERRSAVRRRRADYYVQFVCEPDPATPDWSDLTPDEQGTFAHDFVILMELEGYLKPYDWPRLLSPEAFNTLKGAVDRYHDTLPFSDTERRWLIVRHAEAEDDPTGPIAYAGDLVTLAAMREDIVSSGRRQAVTGRELIHRWWDWRRGTGDFQHLSARDDMRSALAEMASLIRAGAYD